LQKFFLVTSRVTTLKKVQRHLWNKPGKSTEPPHGVSTYVAGLFRGANLKVLTLHL
jgi:hypothetical protein